MGCLINKLILSLLHENNLDSWLAHTTFDLANIDLEKK